MRPLVASILTLLVTAPAGANLTAGPAIAHTATGPAVPEAQDHPGSGQGPRQAVADETATSEEGSGPATHTVSPGDTLWQISEDHLGAGERYREVYDENSGQLSSPHLIHPGTVLRLPGTPERIRDLEAIDVTVAPGDTLSGLATQHLGDAGRWPEIYAASTQITQDSGARLVDPDLIQPGWQLHVPVDATDLDDQGAAGPQPETSQPHSGGTAQTPPEDVGPDAAPARGAVAGRHLGAVSTPDVAIGEDTTPAEGSAPAAATQPGEAAADSEQDDRTVLGAVPWLVAGLAGGGGILAGALWLALRGRRRAQSRHRRPGLHVGVPLPAELAPLEQTTQTVGAVAAVSLETLDRVLKHLVAPTAGDASASVPQLVAARLSNRDGIDLFLADPQDYLPHPWEPIGDSGTRWRLANPLTGPAPDIDAPYPLLATIGTDDTDGTWLLNLEGLHVAISGDPTMAHDLTRHLTAGALLNPWSQSVQIDCLGIGQELQPVAPSRVSIHDTDTDTDIDLEHVHHHLEQTTARARHHQVSAATGRVHGTGDDTWPARLVIAGTDTEQTRQLADTISADPARVSAAIVMATPGQDRAGNPSLLLDLTPHGRVQVAGVGLDLVAVGLTADEAAGVGMLCAAVDDHREQPVPSHDVDDPQDLRHYIDHSGALLEPHRSTPAHQAPHQSAPELPDDSTVNGTDDHDAASVLPAPAQDCVAVAATTEEDLHQIAPPVTTQTRDRISDADPTLDADLAAWHDPQSKRARLQLLGPVQARTSGAPQSHSKGYLTEILAYLALRPDGATPDQLADDFGLTRKKARDYVSTVRAWLGEDPATGQLHLPYADDVVRHDGVKLYRLHGVLVDADLFKRLHARGVSRGPDGLTDLLAALQLVTGQPFDRLRPQGWGWLFQDAERVDQYLVVGIGAVAHLVTVHSLETGDLDQARWATQVAKKADPYAETPNLDLAAIAIAEGRHQDSAKLLRAHVTDRSDDHLPPPELPARTEEILDRHKGWLEQSQDAAAS
ncbi:hypothetical protein BJF86_13445 [Serinicoccus sp. CNJ-927]|nr:hypothetical protein BJF86_13445 [Serinicoccus sp. CNJ-927]